MSFRGLDESRAVCERLLPGLVVELGNAGIKEVEKPGSLAIDAFRRSGGPGLVIPAEYSGSGASPIDAISVTRAIGAAAPSLAVATTMHHFSMATIFTLADSLKATGVEWLFLEAIAEQKLLVSSGFSEGTPGQGILAPVVSAKKADGGLLVTGSKKPCSLSSSMDFLSASALVDNGSGESEMVLLMVPSESEGISVHPFWTADALAAAESDEVRLTDVFVDDRLVTPATVDEEGQLDEIQTVGFMWFELLITACYLGMASALAEKVIVNRPRTSDSTKAKIVTQLESANALLGSIAARIDSKSSSNVDLAESTIARFTAQDLIRSSASDAVEALGGIGFITDPEVGYLASAVQCVNFHPPSRNSVQTAVSQYALGAPFQIG